MQKIALLQQRLKEIGQSLENSTHALALLGLGSVGTDLYRLDAYSDLDFFTIVEDGHKWRYIEHLDWLECLGPIAYCFRNTVDGYKLMYADGVFCEFAVFEAHELAHIPFPKGRLVWQRADFDANCVAPRHASAPAPSRDVVWLLGEALSNLYIGLGRYQRGERLSALTFTQQYAFQRVLDLAELAYPLAQTGQDPFVRDRRYEQRCAAMQPYLADMLGGYTRIPESALAMLAFLDAHFEVNATIKAQIIALARA